MLRVNRMPWKLSPRRVKAVPVHTETSQRGDCFFHWQTDHVCSRSDDPRDDLGAVALRSVSSCFVQRIYFREISTNGVLV